MGLDAHTATLIDATVKEAEKVLVHNAHGPYHGLPRTAGWGYPEPYTRDLMIAAPGILLTGNKVLINALRRVLETLAQNQSRLGHIPSLTHNREERGASDTTPLFLLALALYRRVTQEHDFLKEAARKSLLWMEYQSPTDWVIVAQQPTSDWRDEQWVLGYGLFVNTLVYTYLRLWDQHERARSLRSRMSRFAMDEEGIIQHVIPEGLALRRRPYYAFWAYKIYTSGRFDLVGNSIAILSGIASPTRARNIITWVEKECEALKQRGELSVDLPPNFFPYVQPSDPEWRHRDSTYNRPGEYHNGGIWPWTCGLYIAALVAAGRHRLAQQKLAALTNLVRLSRQSDLDFGFNEWLRAQDSTPQGQDWQTWSAAMYIYAAECVKQNRTPFFDQVRDW
ncbi:MAG: amylo-alpha-1,6-glucosidase [Candidatus Neomarinimicrobiota bacterium]